MTRTRAELSGPPGLRHRIVAGFAGNVVEWYDFALCGYLAGVIAPHSILAAGFMMRPPSVVRPWPRHRHAV